MRKTRDSQRARLGCEALEDRLTPVAAYTLAGVGLGTANLLSFDTVSPTVTVSTTITGLTAGETLVGMDIRPQNGQLYALGVNAAGAGTLYNISTRTGVATIIGAAASVTPTAPMPNPATAGSGFGFDFNPLVDRIRIVTSAGQSFVIDQNTGLVVANAPTINGGTTTAHGTSYTNNQANATATTQYTIDAASDSLYLQNPATSATTLVGAITVGGATLNFTEINGFDIPTGINVTTSGNPVTAGSATANLTVGGVARLYSIDLTTGAATLLGTVGTGAAVSGLALQNDLAGIPAVGLNVTGAGAGNLVRFNTATPGTTTTVAITGIDAGDTLIGMSFRPQNGTLIAMGVNGTTGNGTLYRIDPQTGAATVIGAVGSVVAGTTLPNPATAGYGFAFNATVDLIRVITTAGQSFAVNPNTGVVVANAPALNGATTTVDAAAYTNAFGQTTGAGNPTTLYVLDSTTDRLLLQNAGTSLTTAVAPITLNGAPLNFSAVNGFDIPAGATTPAPSGSPVAAGFAYATLVVGGTPALYRINLLTGAATNLGTVTSTLTGLTLADSNGGTVAFQSATTTGNEGPAGVNITLTRTGGTGPTTATVTVTGGTATPGTDFTAGPYRVTFVEGQTTATLTIPFTNDSQPEGQETLSLLISGPGNGAVGAQNTVAVTVGDTVERFGQVFGTGGAIPAVAVVASGSTAVSFIQPYGSTISGGVRVAVGDVDNDGVQDLVTVPASGPPQVLVFSGATGAQIGSFLAYPAAFGISANVAVGDVNNDGFDDIILGTSTALPAILVFSGKDFSQLSITLPFGLAPVGINVASGDVNGDGFDDIIAGTASGLSVVGVISGKDNTLMSIFLPFGGFTVGATVAAGDVDGDGLADILVGTTSLVPAVALFNARNLGQQQLLLFPFGSTSGGANVALRDVNGDGRLDIIAGLSIAPSTTSAFDVLSLAPLNTIQPFGSFTGGVFVG